jgi:TRAP-type C4-dicarboxylate transport system permease small subunit
MKTLRLAVDRLLAYTIGLLLAVMVGNVLWQVFTRFILSRPSSFTEEAARFLMIWVGLLGAAYAAGQKAHLAFDLLTARLEGARKRGSEIFIQSVILLFALVVLVGGGGRLVWIQLSLGQQSAALQLKLGYVYLALPMAGIFIVFYSVITLIELIRRQPTPAQTLTDLNA